MKVLQFFGIQPKYMQYLCSKYTNRNVNDHRKRHFDEKYYFAFGFGTKDLV